MIGRPDELEESRRQEVKTELLRRIRSEKQAVLVVNTRSRRGRRSYAQARDLLTETGIVLTAAYPVTDPARIPEIVAQSVSDGNDFVIVGGGDGTISSVMNSFAFKDVVFGLLPFGTANSFARSLSIPLDLRAAIQVLVEGKLVDVDLGRANQHYFANAASVGLPVRVARSVPHQLKRVLGRAGYLIVAGAQLTRFKPFGCTISLDDGHSRTFEKVLELRIANGPFKGGLLAAEEASVESRDLVLHIVKGRSRLTLAKVWAKIAMRMSRSRDEVDSLRAPAFVLQTDPVQYVSIDGEPVAQTPLSFGVARQALKIMVPRSRSDLH